MSDFAWNIEAVSKDPGTYNLAGHTLAWLTVQVERLREAYRDPKLGRAEMAVVWDKLVATEIEWEQALHAYAPFVKEEL